MPETSVGRNIRIGEIAVGNVVLVSNDGVTADLVATVVNIGDVVHTLTISQTDPHYEFDLALEPDEFVQLGRDLSVTMCLRIERLPGSLSDLDFEDEAGNNQRVGAPVVTDDLPEFAGLSPTGNGLG